MAQIISANPWYLFLDIEDWFMGCAVNVQSILSDAAKCLKSLDEKLANRCLARAWNKSKDSIDELMFDIRFVLEQFFATH